MRLVEFSITNFRSITKAHKLPLSDTTVLVGKNSEGKSNLLKALAVAMRAIVLHGDERVGRARRTPIRRRPLPPSFYSGHDNYEWQRDFPIGSQNRKGAKQTIFRLEFKLTDDEVDIFRQVVRENLNGTLVLEVRIGEDNRAAIKTLRRGPTSQTLNDKSNRIARFVAKRVSFNYIPAIRTHEEALLALQKIVSSELLELEEQDEYRKALEAISELQRPVLAELANRIKVPLSEFLPNIKGVEIRIDEDSRRVRNRRDFEVIIDDGVATNIEFKGDGVKSLAALGLLKDRSNKGLGSIIAIEEPESHLHPGAIHQLKEIISSLADENQIIITTHNPLFVNRSSINSNIIVESGKATPAKKVETIRDVLGIRISDNLMSNRYVLVVEGSEDQIALNALLPVLSDKLSNALKNHLLVINSMGGAGNLPYKLSTLENQLCVYHVLLDHDAAGNKEREKAVSQRLLKEKNLTQTICNGMKESEFEDCIDATSYSHAIYEEYGVDVSSSPFKGRNKWSDRMRNLFLSSGKTWTNKVKARTKFIVAQSIVDQPNSALHGKKRSSIDALVIALEELIGSTK